MPVLAYEIILRSLAVVLRLNKKRETASLLITNRPEVYLRMRNCTWQNGSLQSISRAEHLLFGELAS